MKKRDKIFISHSNPDDNDSARWLGLQLMTLGYEVWCDVFNLKGGEKFWSEIEAEIRNNTCKFLYILTRNSNQKDGCLNELSVAEAVEKQLVDKRFIIALHFDPELKYDDVNINLKRKIDLNFKTDWQQGLKDLLKIFNEEPKAKIRETPDFAFIQNYWASTYLQDRRPIEKDETYTSNWFQFISFPEKLYLHNFSGMIPKKFDWKKLPFPTYGYKKLTATFGSCYDFVEQLPKTEKYDPKNSRSYDVLKILNHNLEDDFISNRTLRNIINNLINVGFINTLKQRNELMTYEMSNKVAFCFKEDMNVEAKFGHGQLVGKRKERQWHFAFSGFPDLVHNVFVFRSHILLSENGEPVKSKRIQQSGRRGQGANWWNKHWKHKLLSAISHLVDENSVFKIEVGAEENILVNGNPLSFYSKISYLDPDETKDSLNDYSDEEEDTAEEEITMPNV